MSDFNDDPYPAKKRAKLETNGLVNESILDITGGVDGANYVPVSKESRQYYGLLMHLLQEYLGDISDDILKSATNDVLEVLKNKERTDAQKKAEIEEVIMGTLSTETYTSLINISKQIRDYSDEYNSGYDNQTNGDTVGVSVVFDDEDNASDDNGYAKNVVSEDEDDDADEGGLDETNNDEINPSANGESTLLQHAENDSVLDTNDTLASKAKSKKVETDINVLEIDAFWIQRTVGKYIEDPYIAEEKSNEVLEILENENLREVENSLMELFDYEHFDLVKLLTSNSKTIYWCIKLATAAEDEKISVMNEIKHSGNGEILDLLKNSFSNKRGRNGQTKKIQIDIKATTVNDYSDTKGGEPREDIDLDSMRFKSGSHLMSNKKCILPAGTSKREFQGYQEIHIPAPEAEPITEEDVPIKISSLPEWSQSAFPGTKQLNRVQSRVFPIAFHSDENMLLCAPTGAGKTNCAMLTVLREIGKNINPDTGEVNLSDFKIVYVAPMKALVSEMVGNFSAKLEYLGIKVAELTGDSQITKQQLSESQIIVTTPEKWDVVTRKGADTGYTRIVRLIIIDEVHLLHDDRGPVLEAIVARTLRTPTDPLNKTRIVGLSATLPNYIDVAEFLRVNIETGLLFFHNAYRPCPLEQQYIGITDKKAIRRFQMMNEITYSKILENAGKNQMIVFVHSRKDTHKTANVIKDIAIEKDTLSRILPADVATREILKSESENVSNAELKELLPYGFGIHHAGLTKEDRTLVEDLFADGHIQVLFSTATLAWGVNLPAHSVIIKGTQIYNAEVGGWIELSSQDVLQMLGRAGRPQYDTFGEGIIITTQKELQFYLSLLNEQLPIESQLVSRIVDIVNSEISLGTIGSIADIVDWLSYTYLFVRMRKNPSLYKIDPTEIEEDPELKQKRLDIAHAVATLLDKGNLVNYDRHTGIVLSTELGRVASYYYITYSSITTYNNHLKPSMGMIDILRVFALSDEFKSVSVRDDEKAELVKLLEKIPVPVSTATDDHVTKVNVLLQSYISQIKLNGFALFSDMVYVTQSAERIIRALFEMSIRRGWAGLCHKLLDLCKVIEQRSWSSMSPLRQIPWFPLEVAEKLERKEFPWSKYFDLNVQELGELVGIPKAGKVLHRAVHQFPKLDIRASVQPLTPDYIKLELVITADFMYDETVCKGFAEQFWVIIEDVNGENILYHDIFLLRKQYVDDEHVLTFTLPILKPIQPVYFATLVSDRWLHCQTRLPISLRDLILPSETEISTTSLGEQKIPVSALKDDDAIEVMSQTITEFNGLQSQLLKTVYKTDENVLIASPPGTGKTTCAELALLRFLEAYSEEDAKCIYMCTKPEEIEPLFKDWSEKFSSLFEKYERTIVKLDGELSKDITLLDQGDIIFATAQQWDQITRRWKQRKSLRKIRLFIADDIHLISDIKCGPTTEITLSRMRIASTQLEIPMRMIMLSSAVGNANDLGDWLGVESSNVISISPDEHTVPTKITVHGFNVNHYPSLMIAMISPLFKILKELRTSGKKSSTKKALVFTSSRKQTQLSAMDLMSTIITNSAIDEFTSESMDVSDEDLNIKDVNVKVLIKHGIGYIHDALTESDVAEIISLYRDGRICVLFCPRYMAYGMDLTVTADSIVVLGTSYFDGKLHRYVDYEMHDIHKMIGKVNQTQEKLSIHIMTQSQKADHFKKFVGTALPVESNLDSVLQDAFNAEIVAKIITGEQDAIDYLTWTLFYRRLALNPNYYNLANVTPESITNHISTMVQSSFKDLQDCKLIDIEEEDGVVTPLNLGIIASYYCISYITVDVLSRSVTAKYKLKHLLQVICASAEFDDIPIRHHEKSLLIKIYSSCPIKIDNPDFEDPHFKTNIILQAHFSRINLPIDLDVDRKRILSIFVKLLQATVDVISSSGWLSPCIFAMELSQMCVQAMWNDDSPLIQLPHISKEIANDMIKTYEIDSVMALMGAEDDIRDKALSIFNDEQVQDIANFANNYPDIEVGFELEEDEVEQGDVATLMVNLTRPEDEDEEETDEARMSIAPRFPTSKPELWWLVVSDSSTGTLLSVKRTNVKQQSKVKLEFVVPDDKLGKLDCKLLFISDSYLGVDQELEFSFNIIEEQEEEDDEDEDDEEEGDNEV